MQVICKKRTVLHRGPDHPQILMSEGIPGTKTSWTPRDDLLPCN